MHQRSLSELQGVSTQRGASTRRTTQDRASWSSKLRRGSGRRCLCPPTGAPLWAWLLLGALVVPGAWSFLSEEQEELLVELHNYYRGQVSPTASAMLPLRWDPNLKLIAEGYSAKCIWNHNPELEDTGENLFAGTGPLDLREALEKWFLEHLDYDFQNNSCDEDKMCGHYTQMVWADTHRVGCAFHLCNNMEGLDWERVSFLVCNYYPAGNYEDERPYVEGDWCSRCPENLQKCENNLCVPDMDNDDEEGGTVLPPAASTSSLQPEEEKEEMVVTPPAITDLYVQTATTTTASTPSATTSTWDSEDNQPPASAAPSTHPPEAPSTTLGKEEKVEEKMEEEEEEEEEEKKKKEDEEKKKKEKEDEEKKKEEDEEKKKEEDEEKKKKAEEKRKEPTEKEEGKAERDVAGKIYNRKVTLSAGSVSSPSLLLACLTGILTLML